MRGAIKFWQFFEISCSDICVSVAIGIILILTLIGIVHKGVHCSGFSFLTIGDKPWK